MEVKVLGKNTIANAILNEKVFRFWTSLTSDYIKQTRRVSGTQIHLTRIPGWRGDLSRSKQTKREIVYCVQALYETGPHAVILVLKVNSVLSESNISTLESLLTVQLWNHTIVLFTHGEKLGGYTIEDYIRCHQLQDLIDKCGGRFSVIQNNDSNQITETVQELIARKNSASCFKLSAQTVVNNTLESDLGCLVERIKSKITSLLASKEKLNTRTQNNNSIERLLDSKDAEIRRLNAIVQEKEREIERLRSRYLRTQDLDPSGLRRRIAEVENQRDMMSNELKERNTENEILKKQVKEKDAEIEELKIELKKHKQEAGVWRTHEDETVFTGHRRKFCQGVSTVSKRSFNQTQLQVLPSKSK